ncbi:hypothetical protein [Yersinia phage fHe-Yen9-04]|uniref:Uncharacterized protein n=1 Tax=Yersinia phage fHe-Yen9-04 TaxID=2052742 RepID=A0A2C9D0B9_9CAUD|nr:hypothetical protein FDJ41_gp428 [Yersinia phage fHe-Yen9-04]SOK58752.1 hypothetical protein [Yersinia phage fHe-Yen9-04]VUE36521.1 hypothetical protein [Yersinia phage fHe-Yen9-04]
MLTKLWNFFISLLGKFWNSLKEEPANNVLGTDISDESTEATPEENVQDDEQHTN